MFILRNLSLFIVLLLLAVQPLSAAKGLSYAEIRADYHRLLKSSQLQRQRTSWEKVIRRFDHFIQLNANDFDIDKAFFLRARTWEGLSLASGGQEDAREAINHYLEVADRFPTSRLADDALYAAGQLAENRLKDLASAYRYYSWLIEQIPKGDMVKAARSRLTVLPVPVAEKIVPIKKVAYSETADSPRLEKIRYWSGPEYTRVVLDLSAPVVAKPNLLKGPNPRLYFDLLYTDLGAGIQTEVPILNGLVQRVRASRFDEQRTRIVLDLYRVADYKLVTLDNPHRLVIDILGPPERAAAKQEQPVIQAKEKSGDDSIANILDSVPKQEPVLHVPKQKQVEGIRLIVVDAGHGGRDPGAVGPSRVLEKNVTLKLAKEVAKALRKQLGVKVLMTRTDDRFIELRDRTSYANRVGADLFISLHANASKSNKVYGLETYFLNLSKNDQAAEVAARENGTTLQDVGNLEAILFDLMANAKINESSRLAAEVQQSMVAGLRPHYSRIKDLGVRQGPFHVLLGATMPSVLVEAAFISNKREEIRLNNRNYQKRVAAAIVDGVKSYSASVEKVARR